MNIDLCFQELICEQELFTNILQVLSQAPYVIHSQCETRDKTLPCAKFDLLLNHEEHGGAVCDSPVVLQVNGYPNEETDVMMSDISLNLAAPSMLLLCTHA